MERNKVRTLDILSLVSGYINNLLAFFTFSHHEKKGLSKTYNLNEH